MMPAIGCGNQQGLELFLRLHRIEKNKIGNEDCEKEFAFHNDDSLMNEDNKIEDGAC